MHQLNRQEVEKILEKSKYHIQWEDPCILQLINPFNSRIKLINLILKLVSRKCLRSATLNTTLPSAKAFGIQPVIKIAIIITTELFLYGEVLINTDKALWRWELLFLRVIVGLSQIILEFTGNENFCLQSRITRNYTSSSPRNAGQKRGFLGWIVAKSNRPFPMIFYKDVIINNIIFNSNNQLLLLIIVIICQLQTNSKLGKFCLNRKKKKNLRLGFHY